MARKPRDYDAELQALMERAKKVKTQKTTQLGEMVQVVGADTLPMEALAGALLAAVEQSKKTARSRCEVDRTRPELLSARGQAGEETSAGDTAAELPRQRRS